VKKTLPAAYGIPCLLFILLAFSSLHAFAQGNKIPAQGYEPADAEEHFKHHNYIMALRVYKELFRKDPKNVDFNYKIALCYLNTNINKKEAISYLEFVTKQEKYDVEALFDLGKAYHYANRFDEAIKTFNKFKEKTKAKGKDAERIDREIEMCNNGKELVKYPVNVTFENLKEVNSEFPDYYPFTTSNESFIVFTSRRKGNVGASSLEVDGYYSSDIYMASVRNGVFSKPKNLGAPVNGNFDEQCVGLAPDGTSMMVYIDNLSEAGNIYQSTFNKTNFAKPVKLPATINEGFETSASLSPDGNTMFFSSKRDGTKGSLDIFMVKKLPTGAWALPQPINSINTKYDEDFPFMAADGKTLYFASEGHSSMGGFDIFKSVYDEDNNAWSAPKNLGYPINDSQDNRTISFSSDNRTGYISAVRDGGMGDLDIYRITFDDAASRYTIVTGKVQYADTLQKKNVEATITVTNSKTSEDVGTYIPVPGTGKYVMALPPGKYIINIDSPGCKPYIGNVLIMDLGSFQPEMTMNMTLNSK
jgi:tetratricopeptide (TPR) repeat protein